MKQKLGALLLLQMVIGLCAFGQENSTVMTPEMKSILVTNMPGYSLSGQGEGLLLTKADGRQKKGARQTLSPTKGVLTNGAQVEIRYFIFDSKEEAVAGASYHVSHMQWIFKEGGFGGAAAMGDRSWVSTYGEVASMMLAKGRFVLQVTGLRMQGKQAEAAVTQLASHVMAGF